MGEGGRAPADHTSDFSFNYSRARVALEAAVEDLMTSSWEESRRRLAHEMAVAMTHAAKAAGWWDTESILRPLSSLLALSAPEVMAIRPAVHTKLIEFLVLLRQNPASRSA